jgi:hypothetical protein
MKRILFILCVFAASINGLYANVTLHYDINYSKNDFAFTNNAKGELMVSTSSLNASYNEQQEYLLPRFPVNIGIQENKELKTIHVTIKKRLLQSNATLVKSSEYFDNVTPEHKFNSSPIFTYDGSDYLEFVKTDDLGYMKILYFSANPFIYDAEQNLYLIESLGIDIELSENPDIAYGSIDEAQLAMVQSFLINKSEVSNFIFSKSKSLISSYNEKVEYVIITNRALHDSFKPLATWKRTKGISSRIYCVEDIEDSYSEGTTQLKIKRLLYTLYQKNNLKYVLLGGDDIVVPAQGCYMSTQYENYTDTEESIPTDLYYACFLGNFEWNANGNNLYGESDDQMVFVPSIYVTRAPVRTEQDTKAFVNKVISYERKPVYNHNLLRCGKLLSNYLDSGAHSDAEIQSDSLYYKYIKPYWDGESVKLYDTYTDFATGAEYDFTKENLTEQIAQGYSFVDIITHGIQTQFMMESSKAYNTGDGATQTNRGHTIITTTACDTNAFDTSVKGGKSDPCLSESLLRNPNSGIIAYLGSSRKGYYNKWEDSGYNAAHILGESETYNGLFYKYLFSEACTNKSYGEIVANAKYARSQWNGLCRRIQYALNPMGDPEMPIFISKPKEFSDCKIALTNEGIQLNICEPCCKICIMSSNDDGASYYKVYNTSSESYTITDYPQNMSICITKQGFIPKQYLLSFIQNEVIEDNNSYNGDAVFIGSNVNPIKEEGEVIFKSGITTIEANEIIIQPETTIAKGAEVTINAKNK